MSPSPGSGGIGASTSDTGRCGQGRVMVVDRPGPAGTFAQFVDPLDLGREFTCHHKRYKVVFLSEERLLAGMVIEENEAKYTIHRLPHHAEVTDVGPRPRYPANRS